MPLADVKDITPEQMHDKGWLTQQELDDYNSYIKKSEGFTGDITGQDNFGADFSPGELAAKDKFEQVKKDHGKPDGFGKYDEKNDYFGNDYGWSGNDRGIPKHVPDLRSVPGGDGDGKDHGSGYLKVNTEAIEYFSGAIEVIEQNIRKAREHLVGAPELLPGNFGYGYKLSSEFDGLKSDTQQFTTNLIETLVDLRSDIKKLVADLEEDENLNTVTAQTLSERFESVTSAADLANKDTASWDGTFGKDDHHDGS